MTGIIAVVIVVYIINFVSNLHYLRKEILAVRVELERADNKREYDYYRRELHYLYKKAFLFFRLF